MPSQKVQELAHIRNLLNHNNPEAVCKWFLTQALRSQTRFQDIVACLMLDCTSSCNHVRYFVSRTHTLSCSRLRKDFKALARIVTEVAMVLYNWHHACAPTDCCVDGQCAAVCDLQPLGMLLTSEVQSILRTLLESSSNVHDGLAALCSVKGYELVVPIDGIPVALCKDPLWIAWKMLLETTRWKSSAAKRYVQDLFTLYKYRYKKSLRKERLVLLSTAWRLYWGCHGVHKQWTPYSPVILEAVLKSCYLYEEVLAAEAANRELEGGKDRRSSQDDIIGSMLL